MNGKEIFFGLTDVGDDLIEKAEHGQFSSDAKFNGETNRIKRTRKPLLIAAIVALMVLLMGCAVLLLHLEDLRVGEETYVDGMRYTQDGSKIPETEKVRHFISIGGAEGGRNYQALKEWMEFKQSYDPDGTIWKENSGFEKPAQYNNYVDAYSQQMLDKIDELCQKYDLKLEGAAVIFQRSDGDLFSQALGIDSVVNGNQYLQTEFGGARAAESGNFNASYQATLKNPQTQQEFTFTLIYDYRSKDCFSSGYLMIEDGENVEQWNHKLPDGTDVLIASDKGGDAYLLIDREDAFIDITIRNVGWNWDSPGDVMSHRDMELIAESLDFSLKPQQIENITQLQQSIEERYQAIQDATEDPEEAAQRRRVYEENEFHDNYGDLICQIRDNESYFTDHCNVAYENFWDTMDYTLRDVTGDGEDELILGRDGHIHEIWTLQSGRTTRIASSYYEGYLCEGNIFEHYVFLDGRPYHHYSHIEEDGRTHEWKDVDYDPHDGWVLIDENGTNRTLISEEQAMEIINSYVRIPLEMESVKTFPLS